MILLSTAEIEKQIAHFTLHFDSLKDEEIEWRYQPPLFVAAFVEFVNQFRRIPTQHEFKEFYVDKNRATLNDDFSRKWNVTEHKEKKRALMARLERAYPSFVRDIYLLALLHENGMQVNYDPTQDVESGVDLSVGYDGREIQVHVFLDSPRSKQGRVKKDKRHTFVGKHLDITLHHSECKQVGDFWLPTQKHVQRIQQALVEA